MGMLTLKWPLSDCQEARHLWGPCRALPVDRAGPATGLRAGAHLGGDLARHVRHVGIQVGPPEGRAQALRDGQRQRVHAHAALPVHGAVQQRKLQVRLAALGQLLLREMGQEP